MQLALFGEHIENSPSPEIHKNFAQQFDIELDYKKIIVTPENFIPTWKKFVAAGGNGANITMPHKHRAYAFCTELSPAARAAESVNTIKINSPTDWYGDNTDGIGFVKDLVGYYQHSITGKNILVLGAGGAASGILPALLQEQPKSIVITNRTFIKAETLAAKYKNVSACELSNIPQEDFDLVVNTSSTLSLPELKINFSNQAVAYDIRYKPEAKIFMQWAKERGAKYVYDGYGMLLEQAAAAFAIWFGVQPSTQQLRIASELL